MYKLIFEIKIKKEKKEKGKESSKYLVLKINSSRWKRFGCLIEVRVLKSGV